MLSICLPYLVIDSSEAWRVGGVGWAARPASTHPPTPPRPWILESPAAAGAEGFRVSARLGSQMRWCFTKFGGYAPDLVVSRLSPGTESRDYAAGLAVKTWSAAAGDPGSSRVWVPNALVLH